MTLCDTGPLVALIDVDDPHHERCAGELKDLPPEPLVTTWPCFTEAMYLLARAGGKPAQDELWEYLAAGVLTLHVQHEEEWRRMRILMGRYADTPMDLADASLVAAAESLGARQVFTLDRHFRAYRLQDGGAFHVVPAGIQHRRRPSS